MAYGFVFAALAAFSAASSAILQSIGARRIATTRHLDPRLLLRLVSCGPYAAGLALDGASSGLTIAALRTVPLFAVQAVAASNLGIIALLTTMVLRARLRRHEWLAVGAVVGGLVLIVASARTGPPLSTGATVGWALVAAVAALSAVAYLASRRLRGAALSGLLAGLTFGCAATAARVLGSAGSLAAAVASPAAYALVLGGVAGTLLYAGSLQRGSVTTASAMTVAGQTIAPAVAGWLLLGDGVRHGFTAIAVIGFGVTVAGALGLSRHAQPGLVRSSTGG
jgi:drug/metabolite transporter (DMT)-like permease